MKIGGQRIVIIGAQHHQRVAPPDGGIHLLHHGSAVEAAALLAEVETGGVAASVAVRHGAVAQADLLHRHRVRQGAFHQLPQGQRVGGAALGGVERQDVPDGSGLFPVRKTPDELGHGGVKGCDLIGAADLGLGAEVPQGAGGLHQRPPQKGAAGLVGGEHHVPRHVLCVKLPHAGDHQTRHAATQQRGAAAQAGEHPVIRFAAATLIQRHGKQQPLPRQALQPRIGVAEHAALWQQGLQQLPQGRAVPVLRQ